MKLQPGYKALMFALLALTLTASTSAYESEFTTAPPDTQTVGEEFTVAGEVDKSGYWETDLESIMVQYSPEGSSTWFIQGQPKDYGCFGSSCSITRDSVNHDTAENVEYRIVAMNNQGNTVPFSPGTETVEFVELERDVSFVDMPSDFEEGETYTITAEASDSAGGLYAQEFKLEKRVDRGPGMGYGSWEDVNSEFCWDDTSGETCVLESENFQPEYAEDHQLRASITTDSGVTISEMVRISVDESQTEPAIALEGVSATDYSVSESDGSTTLKADIRNNRDELLYVSVEWTADGETLASDYFYISSDSIETVRKEVTYSTLENTLETDTEYDLEATAEYGSVSDSGTAPEPLLVEAREQEEPDAELNSVSASEYQLSPGEETELRAEVENNLNEQAYVRVTWTADGTVLVDKWDYVSPESTETIDGDISYYTLRGEGLSVGQDYDLEGRLRFNSVDESDTASESLRLQEEDDFSITDYGPSGSVESPVELFVDLDSNPSTGWCKWEEGDSVGRDSSTTMAKPDSSVAEWSIDEVFSQGSHTVSFQCFNHDRSITGEETTTFTVGDDQQVEIRELQSTDTHIEDGEETDFEAQIHANEDFGYLEVDFYVDGQKVRENNVDLDSGETFTVSNTLSWNELESNFQTGQDHDLEVRLNSYELDSAISQTEENEFYLAESGEETSCQQFSGSDLDVDLVDFESVPEEGNDYDSRADLINNGDTDVGGNLGLYIKESGEIPDCDFYNDHINDLVGFAGGNVYPDAGSSESFSFSYSGSPIEDLEYGETYYLVAVFSSDSTIYVGTAGAIQWQRAGDEDDNDPTARFSWDDHPAVEDESVSFDGSGSTDPDSDIEEYRWDFDDGSGYSYGETVSNTFTSSGTYDVELRVEDSNGNTDTRTRAVEVVSSVGDCSINVGRLNFGDAVITRGESTQASTNVHNNGEDQDFTVKFKVDGDTVRTIEREISGGSQSTFTASVSPEVDSMVNVEVMTEGDPCGSRTYERTAELVVVEGGDDDDDDDTSNAPDASFSWTPSQPQKDDTVTFDASGSSDSDGDIVEYEWYFGDGSTPGYGRTVQHSYDSIGEYDVQLVVEDSEGNTDPTTRTVPVVEDPDACSLRVGQIRFDDPVITRGDSTVGEITVSNLGEEQVVNLRFKVGSNVVHTQEVAIGENSQRTFSTAFSPEVDSIVTVEVDTSGEPCGTRNYDRHAELVVVEGGDQSSTLNVNVRADDGRRLYNAEVEVTGEDTATTRYTGANGAAHFELGEGDYNVVISKTGYSTETRNIELVPGEHRTITVTLDSSDDGQGTLVALVEDTEGDRLEDAEITVENGVSRYRETDSNGRTTVDLNPGTYTVTAEKTGYGSWTESVHINRGEQTVRVFRLSGDSEQGLNIADVNYPNSVCRGSTMTAEVVIDNNAGYHELVSLTGTGLGSINMIRSFSLDTGETVSKTLHFTNVQGSGTEEFTLTANNQDSDSVTRTVEVDSCGVTGTGQASDISMQLDYTVQPNMAVYGDILKVNGFVDGTNGRANVDIKVSGETKASVRTQPDGYYQTWITADEVGPHTVTAEAGQVSASRPLRVIPISQVTAIEAPVSAFEGQTFQVCAQVESQIEPEVILERDGEVLNSKNANGRVCFERQAREPGTHAYRVAALTSGEGNSASTTVEVLEMDVEASSFPDQIASVESGSGLVKVDLYNTNDNQTRYDLKLEGIPDTWVSQSEKQVILDKGERRTIYFYLTPQEEGTYQPEISVRSRGEEIYRENLDVITGGTTDSNPGEGDIGIFGSIWRGIVSLFSP